MEVLDIFGLLHPKLKLKPPIRLFEAFAGIGTQAMALKRITDNFEIVGFSEIDPHAIRSYQAIHGEDIKNYGDITKMETIPECDIFTWSFPCTDISKAGQNKGMSKKTRSGLVYEVLRLVSDSNPRPKVLIMENVPDLIQEKYRRQFAEIHRELETYGYMNYVETLNAKDYDVAQNRNRVFMVSILGDYSYSFPQPFPLELRVKRLKDYLEPHVDKKYYLSKKLVCFFEKNSRDNLEKGNGFRFRPHDIEQANVAFSITTKAGSRMDDNFIIDQSKVTSDKPKLELAFQMDGYEKAGRVYSSDGISPTIDTMMGGGREPKIFPDLTIRKLTPRECWRLMGIDDEDFDKAQEVNSNSQLYKQAGNAIVVDVFEAILREMIDLEGDDSE